MKVPDKIYLPNGKETIQNGLYRTWFDTDEHDMPYAEYIRKEVLLEWAKANLQDSDNWHEKSAADAFCEMIDKLNEM